MALASKSEQELRTKLIQSNPDIGFAKLKVQAKTLWAQAEIQKNLKAIKSCNCEVYYLSLDLNGFDSVRELKQSLEQKLQSHQLSTQRITTVIHAAGTIDDQFIVDKTLERFKKVLKPKIQGAKIF